MRITVDREICDLHGQCVFAAPELFRFRDDGELEHEEEAGEELVHRRLSDQHPLG